MGRSVRVWVVFGVATLTACSDDQSEPSGSGLTGWGTAGESADEGAAGDDDDDDDDRDDAADDDGGSGGVDYDVGNGGDDDDDDGPRQPSCEASDEIVVVDCEDVAPPDSFEALVEWQLEGVDQYYSSTTTPLVANLTDDNGDGTIDLCDTPDVAVVMWDSTSTEDPVARIWVVDGGSGTPHPSTSRPSTSFISTSRPWRASCPSSAASKATGGAS